MTVTCETCSEPFVPQRRSARFCTTACRMAAHRARHSVTHVASGGGTAHALGPPPGTLVAPRPVLESQAAAEGIPVTLSNPPVDIVPDGCWLGMYRIRYRDGSLSDMVNRTRARDALRMLGGAA